MTCDLEKGHRGNHEADYERRVAPPDADSEPIWVKARASWSTLAGTPVEVLEAQRIRELEALGDSSRAGQEQLKQELGLL